MMFYGVIFDLDGTLLDTLDDLCDSVNTVLGGHGLPPITTAQCRQFVGNGQRTLISLSLPQEKQGLVDTCVEELIAVYGENCLNKTKPYDGVLDMLHMLKKRDVRMAILSNKRQQLVEKVVDGLLPRELFTLVYGEAEGRPRKPNPTVPLEMAERLTFLPKEILFLGDSDVDIKTAQAAGMFSVGAAWGFRGIGELLAAKADTVITDPMKLLNLL